MSTKSKPAKKKSSVRLCPQGCSFCLHDKDKHVACPVCLGIVHARRALTEVEACAFCRQLRHSTLERRVMFVEKVVGQTVARQDPALSESDGEEFLVEVPAGIWADHMEFVDELAEIEPEPSESASQPQLELAAHQTMTCWTSAWKCMAYQRMNRMLYRLVSTPQLLRRLTRTVHPFSHCAAVKLDVEWPSRPPAQKPSRFAGFFLPPEPTTVKNCLPMFPFNINME